MQRVPRPRSRLFKRAYSKSRSQSQRKKQKPAVKYVSGSITRRSGLGNKTSCALIYADRYQITGAAAGVPSIQCFRVNSFFDPDFTGIGHQPLGYDQMAALFERYIVTGCKYKITFNNLTANQAGYVGVQISDKEVAGGVFRNILEQGQCQWEPIAAPGGVSTVTLTGYVDCPKVMGQTYQEYIGDSENGAVVGSNPTDNVWMTVFVADQNISSGPNCTVAVELTMYGQFMGSAQTAES